MDGLVWNPKELKYKITDADLYNVIGEVLPIYNTSDFFVEVAGLHTYSQDVTVTGMGRFWYKNSVQFQYLPRNKVESSTYIYESCRQVGTLAEYDFAAVNNRYANSFCLVFLYENDCFTNYTQVYDLTALTYSQRNTLFAYITELTEKGIFVPLQSIFYNKISGSFALFDYSDIIIDKSVDAEQKQEYIDVHKKMLLIDSCP